ncbi:MAG: beta-propeller domain-containing protein [bacterium]
MTDKKFFLTVLFFSVCGLFATFFIFILAVFSSVNLPRGMGNLIVRPENGNTGVAPEKNTQARLLKFVSEDEFKEYLAQSKDLGYGGGFATRGMVETWATDFRKEAAPMPAVMDSNIAQTQALGSGNSAERVSETNAQVKGIDEPDIIKNDGKEIYYSSSLRYYTRGDVSVGNTVGVNSETKQIMPQYKEAAIKLIKSFPPESLGLDSEIIAQGNLLLKNNILMVFTYDKIYGYDVSDKKAPVKKWTISLKQNNYLTTSRLYNGKVYLVTNQAVNSFKPCPLVPFDIDGNIFSVSCDNIYHPPVPVETNSTYTISIINPEDGAVEKDISFVGSANNTVIYMSPNALYATYEYSGDFVGFFADFFTEKCADLIPKEVIAKLAKLKNYDISAQAKSSEIETILNNYRISLDEDENLRVQNEIENRGESYFKEKGRELEKTGIFKVSTDNLEILANGSVPGTLLNQFSLDEYNGYLRTATTISGTNSMFWQSGDSVNDVYVLDKNLNITGSVKDLGETEKIYSVRFIEDKGYVVTFRETDPFYVIDLSSPENPHKKGELKITGYSSYLHPITKDKILGIGRDGGKVKISLFDVSDAENPCEVSKYMLDEYWSDVLNTHHAFLLDSDHKVFFMPGGQGGYIFSYENDNLSLKKAISQTQISRAIYMDNYMYMAGDAGITVIDENTWERIGGIEF